MSKKWVSEIVQVCVEDGEKKAILIQNGEVQIYTLKKATKQDVAELLEVEMPQV